MRISNKSKTKISTQVLVPLVTTTLVAAFTFVGISTAIQKDIYKFPKEHIHNNSFYTKGVNIM
jgi:hypothetical protein